MNCLSCCGKCILIFTNVVFLIFGIAFLALGVVLKVGFVNFIGGYTKSISDGIEDLASTTPSFDFLNNLAIAFIVLGCVIIVIAILGMCGACCDNKCMLATYAAIVLLILVAQIVLVSLAATGQFTGIIENEVKDIIKEDFRGYNASDWNSLIINGIQIQLGCCGWDGSTDYDGAEKWQKTYNDSSGSLTIVIPATCCKTLGSRDCLTNPTSANSNKDIGCYEKVSAYIPDEYWTYTIIVICFFLADEFVLVVFAIYLADKAGKRTKRGNYNNSSTTVTVSHGSKY